MKDYEVGGACDAVGGDGRSYRVLVGKTEGKSYVEDLDVDGRISEFIFMKWDGRAM